MPRPAQRTQGGAGNWELLTSSLNSPEPRCAASCSSTSVVLLHLCGAPPPLWCSLTSVVLLHLCGAPSPLIPQRGMRAEFWWKEKPSHPSSVSKSVLVVYLCVPSICVLEEETLTTDRVQPLYSLAP